MKAIIQIILLLIVFVSNAQVQNDTLNLGVNTPVEVSYSQLTIDNNHPTLVWETVSEYINDYFTISRSTNGINFEEIKRISGAGTSKDKQQYKFIDFDELNGGVYYRLSQTDFDGHFEYLSTYFINVNSQFIDDYKVVGNILSINYYDLNGRVINKNDNGVKLLVIRTDKELFKKLIQ